jgi:hypothetical protein
LNEAATCGMPVGGGRPQVVWPISNKEGAMRLTVVLAAIVAASVVLGAGGGWAFADQTYTFLAAQDAWVNEANPTANYGNATYMSVKDRSGLAEGYLKFNQADLDTLLNKPITSASLFLYQYQGTNSPGDTLNLHRITSDWDESTVDWNSRPGYAAEPVSALAVAGEANTIGWREWIGLESTVSSWAGNAHFGLALENNKDSQNEELFSRFYSSEYSNAALRPYLKVTAAPEPVSMLLFSLGGGVLGLKRWREMRKG